MQFRSPNPDATRRAAQRLAIAAADLGLGEALLVVLTGPLGSGKTSFAKGLAEGLGIAAAQVTSPTFAICNEFGTPAGWRLVHADGYRLRDVHELEDAGFLDWLAPGTLVAFEWGELFADALPIDHLAVTISRSEDASDPTQRRLNAVASGPTSRALLCEWQIRLRGDPELDVEAG